MTQYSIKPSEYADEANLLLDVPMNLLNIPASLVNKSMEEGYRPKDEYHITIIGRDLAEQIITLGLNEDIKKLIDATSWSIEFKPRYIELAKDDDEGIHRQSIIQIVFVPQAAHFYDKLESIMNLPISRPPEHITLFTKNYDKGIGLYSEDDLNSFKVRELEIS
ncbi:MAG: hypothetical protein V4611_00195 [Patescibacteria group bacterium]